MKDRFIVPQFIDSEAKIWGPVTVRQFVIVLVGALFMFIAYKLADFSLFLLEAFLIIVFVALFAFIKVNSAPFHIFALNVIESIKRPNVRIWHKEYIPIEEFKSRHEDDDGEPIKSKDFLPSKKLSELSLIIDTGGVYKGEAEANKANNISYNIN